MPGTGTAHKLYKLVCMPQGAEQADLIVLSGDASIDPSKHAHYQAYDCGGSDRNLALFDRPEFVGCRLEVANLGTANTLTLTGLVGSATLNVAQNQKATLFRRKTGWVGDVHTIIASVSS